MYSNNMLLYYDSIFLFLSLKFKYNKGSIIAQPKSFTCP